MALQGAKYDLQQGEVFEGNYRIVRELGRGGFGVIYLAHQLSMDRPVALKILKPGVGQHDPNARERFLREVRIISKLRHPNTVTIHDYGESATGVVFMVLEYVEGQTLKSVLKAQGAQPPMRALGLSRQIARSLTEAHDHGIIHRDLKPANIMLTDLEGDSDFVKVLDFGVARLRGQQDVDLTSAGVPEGQRALIGTPRYMSPEQVRGEDIDAPSDLYSLGLMLYEMLVGEPAVKGDTTMGLISQQISPEPLKLDHIGALNPALQRLLRRATAKPVEQRFQSGDAFALAIDETAQELSQEGSRHGGAREFLRTSGRFSAVSQSRIPIDDSRPRTHQDTPTGRRAPSTTPGDVSAPQAPHLTSVNHFDYQGGDDPDIDLDIAATTPRGNQIINQRGDDSPKGADTALASAAAASAAPQPSPSENSPDESTYFGIPSSELPDAPDDGPTFDPKANQSGSPGSSGRGPGEPEEESDLAFTVKVVKMCLLFILATFFVYTAFIVTGAMVGEWIDGYMRIAVAGALALAIPLFTALGENSHKERFEVVERKSDRILRVLIGTAIFAAAPVLIISLVMPGHITEYLRGDPNWMLEPNPAVDYEPTPMTQLNERMSFTIADMIEDGTTVIGLYDGTTTGDDDEEEQPPRFSAPPEPTRPGTRSQDPAPEENASDDVPVDQGDQPESGDDDARDTDSGDYADW